MHECCTVPIDQMMVNNLGAWIDVIRNNFLGLCHRRIAESLEGRKFKDNYCLVYTNTSRVV